MRSENFLSSLFSVFAIIAAEVMPSVSWCDMILMGLSLENSRNSFAKVSISFSIDVNNLGGLKKICVVLRVVTVYFFFFLSLMEIPKYFLVIFRRDCACCNLCFALLSVMLFFRCSFSPVTFFSAFSRSSFRSIPSSFR